MNPTEFPEIEELDECAMEDDPTWREAQQDADLEACPDLFAELDAEREALIAEMLTDPYAGMYGGLGPGDDGCFDEPSDCWEE